MTTQKEIDDQIKKEEQAFYEKPFDGYLPEQIMYWFRNCIMYFSAMTIPASPSVIKILLDAKAEDLRFIDMAVVMTTVFAAPFNVMFENGHEAMDVLIDLKEMEVSYNKKVDEFNQAMIKKRHRLYQIAGVGVRPIDVPKNIKSN